MSTRSLLFSIKPKYAEKIFDRSKTVELRRIRPKHIQKGSLALIYVSSPIKSLAGAFKVEGVIEKPIDDLWQNVHDKAGITREEFNSYYHDALTGIGIFFSEVWPFAKPIELQCLKEEIINFHPPQGFRYATEREVEIASYQLPVFTRNGKNNII